MKDSLKKLIASISVLVGTTIGVGIFSLPYITLQVGLPVMLFYLVLLTAVVLSINIIFSEVALKTPDFLRLPGYAKMHLGKPGKIFCFVATTLGSMGTLLVYIIVGGGFLAGLLQPILGGSMMIYVLLYFLIGATYIYLGAKAISKIEFWGMVLFFVSLFVVLLQSFPILKAINIPFSFGSVSNLFLPYGAVLFALWGVSMVPELEEILGDDKKKLKRVIIIGTLIPAVCYLLFILLILAISGNGTTQDAITGLSNILGSKTISLMFLAGLLATFTSFVTVGLNMKKVLWYDMKLSQNLAWAITCFVPLVLFLSGLKDFIKIIGLIGGVALAIEGILVLLMYRKVEYNSKKALVYSLILILVVGLIYEIVYFLK